MSVASKNGEYVRSFRQYKRGFGRLQELILMVNMLILTVYLLFVKRMMTGSVYFLRKLCV